MKTGIEFFKSTILGGLLVLLPALLAWGMLERAFAVVVKMATPMVRLLPKEFLAETPRPREALAVLMLVGACFLFGVLLRASIFKSLLDFVEGQTFGRLPLYAALKNFVSGAVGPKSAGGFKPAMLTLSEGMQRPAYVIEDHGNGQLTVFIPSAPAAFSGMVHVVAAERVVFLDVKLIDLIQSIAQYGAGLHDLTSKSPSPAPRGENPDASRPAAFGDTGL